MDIYLLDLYVLLILPIIIRALSGNLTPANSMNLTIRPSEPSDLDAITAIGVAAFPYEPQWPYRYPYRAQYPEDHQIFTRQRYSEWFAAAETPDCVIMVAEAPSNEDPQVRKVVALSIWRMPTQIDDHEDTHKCPLR